MNGKADVSSSSPTSPSRAPGSRLRVDLREAGLLPPLPDAYLAGYDRDLMEPLRFLAPGEVPSGPGPALAGTDEARADLARALGVANTAYGHPRAGELALELADPKTRVVVTGQQPGLFGGPLYTLSKMIAAARWAAELEARGERAVAIFWVATEDHDYAEVARTSVLTGGEGGGLETLELEPDPDPLVPVGMRALGPSLEAVYARLAEALPGERHEAWLTTLKLWYRPDARFGEAFCRLMVHFMGERTPLLLDAMLPEVKAAQRPWLRHLVEHRVEVESALVAADEAIAGRGFDLQVKPQRGASPLFLLHRRERRRIEWRGEEGWSLRGLEEERKIEDLLARIEENPAVLSAGVLARPAVQDAILGTTLQILGPGELSYIAQAAGLYKVLGIEAPWVTLRPQVLILESHLVEKVERMDLSLAELLGDRRDLDRRLAERAGGNPVSEALSRVERLVEDLRAPVVAADPSLEKPWKKTHDQVGRALGLLADKYAAAAARGDEVEARRIDQLRRVAVPGGRLQERVVSSAYFPGKYRSGFAASFEAQLDLDPTNLQVIQP